MLTNSDSHPPFQVMYVRIRPPDSTDVAPSDSALDSRNIPILLERLTSHLYQLEHGSDDEAFTGLLGSSPTKSIADAIAVALEMTPPGVLGAVGVSCTGHRNWPFGKEFKLAI